MRLTFILLTIMICCLGFVVGEIVAYLFGVYEKSPFFMIVIIVDFLISLGWLVLYRKFLADKLEPKNKKFSIARLIFNVVLNLILVFVILVLIPLIVIIH